MTPTDLEPINNADASNIPVKKRGRKSKKELENIQSENQQPPALVIQDDCLNNVENKSTPLMNEIIVKKRGRKPKGGKIVSQLSVINDNIQIKPNIVLHLKCSLNDLTITNTNPNWEGFSFNNTAHFCDIKQQSHQTQLLHNNMLLNEEEYCASQKGKNEVISDDEDYDISLSNKNMKHVWKKIKQLEHNLHTNVSCNSNSACFWDTCNFDNPPVYIPKYKMNDSYHVYGYFCSPECAVAHLMEENIDSSVKFERYQLLNHLYGKHYNYTKNIKPAPNPYYMLDKYCGNLTIQEYRTLLSNDRMFLVVDKPLVRNMPELHDDNDDFLINNKIIPTNNIKINKLKKQTKANIINEQFGLTS